MIFKRLALQIYPNRLCFFLLVPTYMLFASRELSYQLNISYYSWYFTFTSITIKRTFCSNFLYFVQTFGTLPSKRGAIDHEQDLSLLAIIRNCCETSYPTDLSVTTIIIFSILVRYIESLLSESRIHPFELYTWISLYFIVYEFVLHRPWNWCERPFFKYIFYETAPSNSLSPTLLWR